MELVSLHQRLTKLCDFLADNHLPSPDAAFSEWHSFLFAMKEISGNTSNDMSFVACLRAKQYLCENFAMRHFDVARKAQNAPGLDIDETTDDGRRVIAEIKSNTPCGRNDLGSQQRTQFEKDFKRLREAESDLKFMFVTDENTFRIITTKEKYKCQIPGVRVVLLKDMEP